MKEGRRKREGGRGKTTGFIRSDVGRGRESHQVSGPYIVLSWVVVNSRGKTAILFPWTCTELLRTPLPFPSNVPLR